MDGFGERRQGKGYSLERRRSRSGQMENTFALWRPRVGRTGNKKKKKLGKLRDMCSGLIHRDVCSSFVTDHAVRNFLVFFPAGRLGEGCQSRFPAESG